MLKQKKKIKWYMHCYQICAVFGESQMHVQNNTTTITLNTDLEK